MLKKCPYCGRELPKPRRRLPSGFGQITEIKGKNRSKPFRAMVTVGRKENGRPLCKLLKPVAYFETYEEAYRALEEYHTRTGISMRELFEEWFAEWRKTAKYPQDALAVWKYCSSVYSMGVKNIRSADLRKCVEEGFALVEGEKRFPSPVEKARIRYLFRLLFQYAHDKGYIGEEK